MDINNDILEWLDNTTKVPGILKFAHRFLPDFTKSKSPEFHDKILREILYSYSTHHMSKFDRQVGIVAFRGSAKTTIDTVLLPIYNMMFKGFPSVLKYKGKTYDLVLGEDLIVLTSKTSYVATQRVVNIRNMITGQNRLTEYFGDLKPRMVRDKVQMWKQDAFFASQPIIYPEYCSGTYILGLGAGQMIRGTNIEGYRPSLIVFDDMYSLENTTTPERRQKIDQWFYTEAIGSIDDLNGKAVFIGTIVHEDTVPMKIKQDSQTRNPQWRYVEIPAMDVEEFHNVLKRISYDRYGNKFDMPDDEVLLKWQEECPSLAWPERINLKYLLNVYRSNLQGKTLDYIYQEYLNVIQAPENKQFMPEMFERRQLEYKWENDTSWIGWEDDKGDKIWYNANIYMGIDLASSENAGADETVICVIGILSDSRVAVLQIKSGHMGQRDELNDPDGIDTFRRSIHDIKKRGVVDETLRLADVFHPDVIAVEVVAEQKKTFQEIVRVSRVCGVYHRVMMYKPTTNKIERITSVLLGHYQVRGVLHNKGMEELEYQLEKLGKAKHDDLPDALHIAVSVSRKPGESKVIGEKKPDEYKYLIRDWQVL